MRYEKYQSKMNKVAAAVRTARRYRVLIIAALALLAIVCAVLLSVRGIVYDAVPCPSSVPYGSPLGYRADAVFEDVRYEYASAGKDDWSAEAPLRTGKYRVRAVADGSFGTKRYGRIHTFTIEPKTTDVYVSQSEIEYGALPSVSADLAYNDTISCTRFDYTDVSAKKTEVAADPDCIVALDEEGNDVSDCYVFRPVVSQIGFSPRKINVFVQDQSGIYDGTPLRFDGYELDEKTPLAAGDVLVAEFDDERTEAGETENIPRIKVRNAASGKDVTGQYDVEITAGKLTVEKRPLYVSSASMSKLYDGTALSAGGYAIAEADGTSGLLPGHREILISSSSLTDAGRADNIMEFRIEDGGGRDVSGNYCLFLTAGTLEVRQRPVSVTTGSDAWVYDGQPHSCPDYTVAEGGENSGLLSGHRHAFGTPAEITDAGSAPNASTIRVFDQTGREVTANYAIEYSAGTLAVSPRPITVIASDGTWIFDGEAHAQPGHTVSDGVYGLVAGHYTMAEQCTRIVGAGSTENDLSVRVFAEDGREVTANYAIEYTAGTLTVLPRPITVYAADAEKIYDGTPLTSSAFRAESEYGEALAAGHTGKAQTQGSQTDAGFSENILLQFGVYDGEGKDVSYNYEIAYAPGTLTVLPRPVTVTAADAEKVYDGTPLEKDAVVVTSEYDPALVAGHTYTAQTEGSVTDAGQGYNYVVGFAVQDADGTDQTKNYEVFLSVGTLTVHPRPVTFRTADNEWIYDGEIHSDQRFTLSERSEYDLVAGHSAKGPYTYTGIRDVGSRENKLSLRIVTEDFADVTRNYSISYENGTLKVQPRPITVRAADAEKIYDGLPLESDKIEITSAYDPAIVAGHMCSFYNSGTQTDAGQGICSVEYFRIDDLNGKDVTSNYAVTFEDGLLTVDRRPVTVMGSSVTACYDGAPLRYNNISIDWNGYTFVNWHDVDYDVEGEITDAGTVPNVIRYIAVFENGRDVTFNYEITCKDGILTVLPRPIILQAGSAVKKYDGTPLTCGAYEWEVGLSSWKDDPENYLLVNGHTAEVVMDGSQTEIGECVNSVASYTIYDGERDVTFNYDVTCKDGSLRVLYPDYSLKIKTGSASKVYDGEELTCSDCEIVERNLPEDFSVTAKAIESDFYVGEWYNQVDLKIIAPDGKDVSRLVEVEYEYGVLQILPRPITVRTASATWPYDGKFHSAASEEILQGSLAENDGFHHKKVTYIRNIGTKVNENELEVRKYYTDSFYIEVTDCYDIALTYGTLEITPSDLYDDTTIGGGLGGGGIEGDGEPVGRIYSEAGGMMYLRRVSYGDYTGRGWRSTIPYGSLLDDTYSMNYLTSLALQNAGRQSSAVRIQMDNGSYVLPYYMALGTGNYQVQSSDVIYHGDTSGIYELDHYFYDYAAEGYVGGLPEQYVGLENLYADFVRENYLAVPDSSRTYLNYVIKEQGFDPSDPNVISAVANYVQKAARYNLEYNPLLDVQTDIVVSFLRDFKEGICQHYASAATLIFRCLGIPARYTVGYAVDTAAGEWTEFDGMKGHAWVEVYLDGVGWIYVEVTGSGPAFGGGGGSGAEQTTISLKPVDAIKQYDGTPLTASAVEGADSSSALALRELLDAGYTYKATFDGSITRVGQSLSSIRSFTLYDANGKKASGFKFKFKTGYLTVVEEAVIIVRPYALQKYYDGTPLQYEEDDYTVAGLPNGYRLELSLKGVGLTDAGILQKSELEALPVAVYDSSGRNVTDQFYIDYDMTNALMVSRRTITVASMSETKLYDGAPLTNGTYWIASGSLVEGHTLSANVTGCITDVGTANNTISSVTIRNENGVVVTDNYLIRLSFGKLTVLDG